MSVDLILNAERAGTVIAGVAFLTASDENSPDKPTRMGRIMLRRVFAGCIVVAILPFFWILWDEVRPLSAHERMLVGTWAVGNAHEIDRWDEDRAGIPCGVPCLEYQFHSDRTYHARRICYFMGCGLFSAGDPGPMCLYALGKWEVRGNDIILLPTQPTPSYLNRFKSAARELCRGRNPLTSFSDDWKHEIHITEWRSDGPLFSSGPMGGLSLTPNFAKLHPSNGQLIELEQSLFSECLPLMLGAD